MEESNHEFAARLEKMRDEKDKIANHLKGLNLTYDELVDFFAICATPSQEGILIKINEFGDKKYKNGMLEVSMAPIKIISSIEDLYKSKAKNIAQSGGAGRAVKFKALESATIKLYQAGKWASAPLAAQEIAPKIVALSSHGNGDLLPSTTRPLQWIRAHIKSLKSNPS